MALSPLRILEAALASAHLAINLRFPTMGEASVSQLQIWAHALPSLVTRVGWYATLPQETVAFVRPEHEIIDIQAHLRAFVDDPRRYVQMGEDGHRFLQAYHTPGAYVQAIIDAVRDAEAFAPMRWRMTWQEGSARRCADGQMSRLRMSPPICGGMSLGRARHRPKCENQSKGSTTVTWKLSNPCGRSCRNR